VELTLNSDIDDAGRPVVVAAGSIDLATRDRFLAFGDSAMRSTGEGEFVLDLAAVTFLDSLGVGALVKLDQLASDRGREMVLRRPSARVVRLLEMVGLNDIWRVES
jgi:anti-sigma B factor antagonist